MEDDTAAQQHVRRAGLIVPAGQPRLVTGAARYGADEVILDLAGADRGDKDTARATVADAVTSTDYGEAIVSVRINAIDTMWAYRDVVDVVERAGEFVDCITVPDVVAPSDVEFVDTLLGMIEQRIDLGHSIGIVAQIDNPAALTVVTEIALVSERLEALVFDPDALGSQLGTTAPGRKPHGDPWRATRMQILVAARAVNAQAIEAHALEPGDDAFEAAARRSHGLGYDGVTCTHPSQLDTIHKVFEVG